MKKLSVLIVFFIFCVFSALSQTWIEISSVNPQPVTVKLISPQVNNPVFKVEPKGFFITNMPIENNVFQKVSVENATPILIKGVPELPKVATSLIIPDNQTMSVQVTFNGYTDYPNMDILPSKGNLTRDIDPKNVPYEYGPEYSQNQFYPGLLAELKDPYILRDFRGQTVITYPYQYNPVTKTLRVYHQLNVTLLPVNNPVINAYNRTKQIESIDVEYNNIYSSQFLNYSNLHKYTPLNENGKMLVICHDAFMTAMQPFVNWKNDKGIPTQMVSVSAAGSTSTAIKSYVQNYYNTNGLTYLLLVGDATQCPTFTVAGGGSDPSYGFLTGSDHYQEIFVGRFSAENVTQVSTQVTRSISYEKNPQLTLGKFNHCVGIGSSEGPGDDNEYDYQHMRNILNDLTGYTYNTRAELFDGSQGGADLAGDATAALLTAEIAKGCGIIGYVGHGSDNSFVTTGFSNTNVNALTNTSMWPFIWAVACVNGNFTAGTCFAEAWLRATSGGQPTGAVATMMSSINQSWNPPMEGQDEMVDILVESYANNIKRSFGGISVNGIFKMNDTYSDFNMTDTWILFGDPSLAVRTDDAQSMTVSHANSVMMGETNFSVNCNVNGALACLTVNHQIIGTGLVSGGVANITFPAISSSDSILLTVTAYNKIPYQSKVAVLTTLYPNDAQSLSIVNPQNTYNCSGLSVSPRVVIRNMGNNTLTAVNVCSVFDGTPSIINWTGNLASLASDTVTFPAITLTTGNHTYKVYTYQPNGVTDIYNTNDTLVRSITVNNLVVSSNFSAAQVSYCNAPASVSFSNSSLNANSYLWDFGDGGASTDVNPVHVYNSLGVFTVKLTANAGVCGNAVLEKTDFITVGATPPSVSDTSVCGSASITLIANGTGTINWYDVATGGTPINTGSNYTTPVLSSNTTYYVENALLPPVHHVGKPDTIGGGAMHTNNSYYLIFDCQAPILIKSVTVYAGSSGNRIITVRNSSGQQLNPPLSVTVPLTQGINVVPLNFLVPAGTNYQMACGTSNPNLYRSSGGINFPYTINGLVSITGSNTTSPRYYYFYDWEVQGQTCISARVPVNIGVSNNNPVADFSPVVSGMDVNFNDLSTNAFNYLWNFGDGSSSTLSNPSHTYSIPGTYQVKQIVFNGCGKDSVIKPVVVTNVGITENLHDISANIFPNPSRNENITIALSNIGSEVLIEIFNTLGARVDVMTAEAVSEGKINLNYNVGKLESGVYYFKIASGASKTIRKFVLTR